MPNIDEDSESEARGAVCPYCKKRSIVYEGQTCFHYFGYFNVNESLWELAGPLKKVQGLIDSEFQGFEKRVEELEEALSEAEGKKATKLEKEVEALQKILDAELGAYQSARLKQLLPTSKYAEDEEEVAVGPKDLSVPKMIFLDKKGRDAALKFTKQGTL